MLYPSHVESYVKFMSEKYLNKARSLVKQPSVQTIKSTGCMFHHTIYALQFSIYERAIILEVRIFYALLTIYLISQTKILSAENSLTQYPLYIIIK
jgi:hypothetical protein